METRSLRRTFALVAGIVAISLAGCSTPQQANGSAPEDPAPPPAEMSEIQNVARIVLGPDAEIVADGDLARNGLEQLVVINRIGRSGPANSGTDNTTPVRITRAVVIEKNAGKWTELLRCDEHLKNQRGYLSGAPEAAVTGWLFGFSNDARQGVEMRFTPLDVDARPESLDNQGQTRQPVVVRWNAVVKRYQSMERTHKEFLDEKQTLEPLHSILK